MVTLADINVRPIDLQDLTATDSNGNVAHLSDFILYDGWLCMEIGSPSACILKCGPITFESTGYTPQTVNCYTDSSHYITLEKSDIVCTRDSSKDTTGQVVVNTSTYNTFIAAGYDTNGTKDKVYLRDWNGEFCSLTINTYPEDSTVTLSYADTEYDSKSYTQKTLTNIPGGKTINYTVHHYGYADKTGSIVVTQNEVKLVSLETGTYPSGMVIFESSTPGTYDLDIEFSQNFEITLVGGGGGGSYFTNYSEYAMGHIGGSGAMVTGTLHLNAGTYNIVVGDSGITTQQSTYSWQAIDGGDTIAFEQIAGGGKKSESGGYANPGYNGDGGIATTTLTGTNGQKGSTTGFLGFGGGGSNKNSGQSGYIKIVVA